MRQLITGSVLPLSKCSYIQIQFFDGQVHAKVTMGLVSTLLTRVKLLLGEIVISRQPQLLQL